MYELIPMEELRQQYRRRNLMAARLVKMAHTVLDWAATLFVLVSLVISFLAGWMITLDYMGVF